MSAENGRPKTRGECLELERPCPYVGCRHHLYLEVSRNGRITFRFPGVEPHEMRESCSLDVADMGDHSCIDVAQVMGTSRQLVMQVEKSALDRVSKARKRDKW